MEAEVFLGVPTYNGQAEFITAATAFAQSTRKRTSMIFSSSASLLAMNFNTLLCLALNNRGAHGFKWFAMLHGDVLPEAWWCDTMIDMAVEHGADVLSAVVPIKDANGLTSTAIDNPADPWTPFARLTQKQVRHENFPQTFDARICREALADLPDDLKVDCPPDAGLLVNTGCFVMRIDREWKDDWCFSIADKIGYDGKEWSHHVQPEDWRLSRIANREGWKVMATTAVRLRHRGPSDFDSHSTWGLPRDYLTERANVPRHSDPR